MSPPGEEEGPPPPTAEEFARTWAEIGQRSAALLAGQLRRQAEQGVPLSEDPLGLGEAFMGMGMRLAADPFRLVQAQMNLAWDNFTLWQQTALRLAGLPASPVAAPTKDDKRFKDVQWQEDFLFDFLKQSYLIAARHILGTVHGLAGQKGPDARKLEFFTRQFVDALSPTNFAATNPEVLRETWQSGGLNLLRGLRNLLRDLETGEGKLRIRMTDPTAFSPGRNVATTPGKVIFQNELMQLLQFCPATGKQWKRPLLIVPPWINKYYILDLREKNSFIKWAVDQGHSVFVISWVNPDEELADKDFEDYLTEAALVAVEKVGEQTGEKEINAIGYCLGGTLLASALAYLAAAKPGRSPVRIVSATFFTTLLDFSLPGELGVFIDEPQLLALEKKMAARGFLEGSEMAAAFNLLRANDLIWSFVVNNYLLGRDPEPFDLLFWNSDSTRMPCRMHSFYLRNMYLENRLKDPGGIRLAGVPIDLGKITTPAYFVSTQEDHIAPWRGTYLGALRLGGPVRFVLGGSGHIAGVVNPPAAVKYGYWTNDRLAATADEWFAGASPQGGSWWNDWQAWIAGQGDGQVPARDPAKGRLRPLEDAPGAYVKLRLDAGERSP